MINSIFSPSVLGYVPASFDASKLSRFYAAIPNRATPGGGGLDVVYIGDSLGEGLGTDSAIQSFSRLFGRALQTHVNRRFAPDTVGGIGFIPCHTSGGIPQNYGIVVSGTTAANGAFNNQTSFQVVRINLGTSGTITFTRNWLTRVDVVIAKALVNASIGAVVTGPGASVPTLSLGDTNLGPIWNPTRYTTNTGNRINGEKRVVVSAIARSATNTVITLSVPTGADAFINGFIVYDGDETSGLRFHNLAKSGWKLKDSPASVGNSCVYRDAEPLPINVNDGNLNDKVNTKLGLLANIEQFCHIPDSDTVSTGVGRGKLIFFGLLLNDQGDYGTNPATVVAEAEQYRLRLEHAVNVAINSPSAPSVCLVIPPCPEGRESVYRIFANAMYQIATANPHCALIDLDAELLAGSDRNTLPPSYDNEATPNRLHPKTEFAALCANVIASAIIGGIQ